MSGIKSANTPLCFIVRKSPKIIVVYNESSSALLFNQTTEVLFISTFLTKIEFQKVGKCSLCEQRSLFAFQQKQTDLDASSIVITETGHVVASGKQ
jgi:hypothetical protein